MRALSPDTARLEIVIEELIRISPCRRGCCEPLDSTHPDTQGGGVAWRSHDQGQISEAGAGA
ncbi:hypothetical protein ACH46_19390 [Gordonia phthalatica]|uniref:Uncharacterized protein n=1 Tax=Gordonia phthalatica TaxID=1136941 RepID=A0A0N9MUG8_9ACTN|nr:hypothetical protein ACH46_19390 [Gordonia phthalatica]